MKPGWWRYVLAHALHLSAGAGALLMAILVGAWLLPSVTYLMDLSFTGWFVLAIFLALPFGWMLGAFVLWPCVGIIAGKINGAPFHPGDLVRILRGPYRDRVAEVDKLWPERLQVRVRLDEKQKQIGTDVFGYHEVCRERNYLLLK